MNWIQRFLNTFKPKVQVPTVENVKTHTSGKVGTKTRDTFQVTGKTVGVTINLIQDKFKLYVQNTFPMYDDPNKEKGFTLTADTCQWTDKCRYLVTLDIKTLALTVKDIDYDGCSANPTNHLTFHLHESPAGSGEYRAYVKRRKNDPVTYW